MSEDRSLICISSSPEFPSLAELITKRPKKPTLRTGSNAAPIPDDVPTTFSTGTRASQMETKAVSVEVGLPGSRPLIATNSIIGIALDSSPLLAPVELPLEVPKKKPRATKATGATRKKKAGTEISAETAEGPISEVASGEPPIAAVAEAKPARKKRLAKTAADGQTTLPKGRVTKPSAKRKVSAKKTESVSRQFSKEPSVPTDSPEARPDPSEGGPFGLEPAIRRKTDWTPPPDDLRLVDDSSAVEEMASTATVLKEASGDLFKSLQDTFGHKEEEQVNGRPFTAADILGKRKLLQMCATITTSEATSKSTTPEVSPAKSKAPKKKPRTITDLAMAAYRVAEEPQPLVVIEAPKQGSIVGYLDGEGVAAESVGGKNATKKPAKPRASRKKPEPKKPILLSPTSAMTQVSRQDFVFGTASQLATEEDPELLRALHEAMKASNFPDDDLFRSSSPVAAELALWRRRGNKLWVAGARDDDGDLLDIEVIDMTESPVVPNPFAALLQETLPTLPKGKEKEASPPRGSHHVPIELSSDFSSFDATPLPKSHFFMTHVTDARLVAEPTTPAPSLRYTVPDPGSVTVNFDLEPPPSNQEHNSILSQPQSVVSPKPMAATKAKAKVAAKKAAPKAKEQLKLPEEVAEEEATEVAGEQVAMGPLLPKYELFTDAQLTKEIASYGFKAVKKRTAMIELLQQCWAHKHKTAVSASGATAATKPASASAPTPASPSRPKGRPKKAVAAEPAQPVKKPRGRPRKDATVTSPSKPATTKTKATATSSKASKSAVAVAPETMEPPAPATPKRRKAAAKAVVEIPDSDHSDSDAFASSPMLSPERREDVFSSPARGDLELSITEDTEMSLMAGSPTTREMEVFDYITKAVMTEPPTRDVTEPSWHEKMLMYDPVILEDLAAWLNLGQLDRVGYDGEVAAREVKSWCESKSICCLWRVNLKGRERKRL
ncbi:hypothetical protein B0T18DRAFT_409935 [Schizothecium vesticola]|uniref:Structure-specific endonuclease subunit SLX4 n=1 Tax=Schizothecium vesticola TaxID=314040 RepID=A0AA40EUE9_9PEZI|nr:hypothetical protein B0T18DRAFT_409935 [Schizothecium vesticola]